MLLNLKIINGSDYAIEVSSDISILNLKNLLANKFEIPCNQQRLMSKGKPMSGKWMSIFLEIK